MQPAILALEDGTIFNGKAIGAIGEVKHLTLGEVVFNTSLTGYQEILTDPSYSNQLVTLTYPHIGNTGINSEDSESNQIYAKGLIIRQLPILASNWRKQLSLEEFLVSQNVLGIQGIDTRKLTRIIRDKGALRGCILSDLHISQEDRDDAVRYARGHPSLQGCDLAKEVTTAMPYQWSGGGHWQGASMSEPNLLSADFHIVAYDFGIKKSLLRSFADLGIKVTVVPAVTSVQEVMKYNPDGVFLSNGPGDPEPCDYAIKHIQQLLARGIPLFGVCLGFQLLALALGAKTFKMKLGHHGGNHPVQSLNGQVFITSQNHGFAVDDASLSDDIRVTHRSLFDNTIQGFEHKFLPAFGFQGHPEAGPGPCDMSPMFKLFTNMMIENRAKIQAKPAEMEL